MISQQSEKKILISLNISSQSPWREEISRLEKSSEKDIALFLQSAVLDQRREVYRLLETLGLHSIPYVHIPSDMEEWELDFLTATYKTTIFGIVAEPKSFPFIANMSKYLAMMAMENPVEPAHQSLFTDEALTRSSVSGICLDLATLEFDRLHKEAKYQASIHTLDHHPLLISQIAPIPASWYRKLVGSRSRRLTDLSDLYYLKHMPKTYFANFVVLEMDNSLDEQIEIREYLRLLIK